MADSALSPISTTVGDLLKQALKESGYLGLGMRPLAEDITDAQIRLQWMLQQWERDRWLVYHNVTYVVAADGRNTPYTIGPTGGPGGTPDISIGTYGFSTRPNRLESAFFRQLVNPTPNGPVDFPLRLLNSMEDYNLIYLKGLTNFALVAFYDPAFAGAAQQLGQLYCWPWPNGNIYSLGVTIREQLPAAFSDLTTVIVLPPEYFGAIVHNLAMDLRAKYGIGTWPGDTLPAKAKSGRAILKGGNAAISNLQMPSGLSRGGIYSIYSDRNY